LPETKEFVFAIFSSRQSRIFLMNIVKCHYHIQMFHVVAGLKRRGSWLGHRLPK